MDKLKIEDLAAIVHGEVAAKPCEAAVRNVTIDSRRIANDSVFFPLSGTRLDGHEFVGDAFSNGAVAAVVSRARRESLVAAHGKSGALVVVEDTLHALQDLAAWWRRQLRGKVIAITGSNGKTIVKDALVQLLAEQFFAAGSPDSFNTQIGVPLALLRLDRNVEYAVLEAGATQPGDMARLQPMLSPDFGILTNVGWAHLSAFGSREGIAEEKTRLFAKLPEHGWLLAPSGDAVVDAALGALRTTIYRFGADCAQIPRVIETRTSRDGTQVAVGFPSGERIGFTTPTPSPHIVADLEMAICAAFLLGVAEARIENALSGYRVSNTRMEIWKSPGGITLINDSCSSDPISVNAALRSLASIEKGSGKRIFVFGGMRELGAIQKDAHAQVGQSAAQGGVDTLVLVGNGVLQETETAFRRHAPRSQVLRCATLDQVKRELVAQLQSGDTVLVKGPRNTTISDLATHIVEAMAPTRFIVDLDAVRENVAEFQRLLGPKTRILAMVKALAYGTDAARLGVELQRMGVAALGVATADEGSALRHAGVDLPILVMLCSSEEAGKVVQYRLTPVVYSERVAEFIAEAAKRQNKQVDVHLEVETGMGRLGIMPEALPRVVSCITASGHLRMTGVMTHFGTADDASQDSATLRQIERFEAAVETLRRLGVSGLIRHACATAGAARFPQARLDMVRVGLGLYGLYPSPAVQEKINLQLAVSLVSRIVEVRTLNRDDRIGYGGSFIVPSDGFRVGVLPVGYHDGVALTLSNAGHVLVNGRPAAILGRVSMDSMIIDLSTRPDVEVNADVLLYGEKDGHTLRPETAAGKAQTIVYELMARLGPRVQRIFISKPAEAYKRGRGVKG
jgi:alanine racemase